jgi:hypothetical protein
LLWHSLVGDLNQQLLPRVASFSKQLSELRDGIVSPSEINNSFISEELPGGISDVLDHDNNMTVVDEIQREGEEEEDHLR